MTAVVIRNVLDDEDVVAAVRPNGSRYRFEMIFDQGRSRAYADSAEDLLSVLMTGYLLLGEQERMAARTRHATDLLAPLQAQILDVYERHGISVTDSEREVLVGSRHEPVAVDLWGCVVPLVLVDVHYRPYGDLMAPMSAVADVADPPNIIWLRPVDPYDYLMSIDLAGVVVLSESNDFLA